jgi:hypothetical protein
MGLGIWSKASKSSKNQRINSFRRMFLERLERREVFNGTYHILGGGDFSQNWSDTSLITVDDDWAGVPSIIGYRGDNITSATGVDPQTLLGEGTVTVDVVANLTNPIAATSGGVAEFEIADPVVAMQGSGTADAPNLVLHLDTTGRGAITISYNLRDVDGGTDNSIQPVALQYRVGTTGNFINIPSAFVADASSGPSLATLVTAVTAVLPVGAEDKPQVQVRIITNNAVGNDEWIGVDDIIVTSSVYAPSAPNFTIATDAGSAQKVEGASPNTTSYTFTVTRDGDVTVPATVDWAAVGAIVGGATSSAGPSDFAGALSGTLNFAANELTQQITVTVQGDSNVEEDEGFTVSLSNATPTGATIGTATANAVIVNDDVVQAFQPGDIVITAISAVPNPDVFTFVPLVDLLPGATFYFTDNGWTGTALGTAEGVVSFTVDAAGIAKGTKIQIDLDTAQTSATVTPSTAGFAGVTGSFALNSTGDSLAIYTASPLISNLVFMVNTGSTYTPTSFSNSATFLPPALTIGTSAVDALGAIGPPATTVPQSQYNHSVVTGNLATLRDAVASKANWVSDTSTTTRITINSSNFIMGPAVIVTPVSGLVTTESGGTATFSVVLNTQPSSLVTIGLSSSNTSEGTVSPASLVFDGANWNVPQLVTVTGVDDALIDGSIEYTIVTAAAVSADAGYNGLDGSDVTVSNTDNDTPGFIVTPTSGLTTTEAGGQATFTIVLISQPTADVTVDLSSSNTAEGTVSPASVVFTSADWNTPKTVTVTGVDDAVNDGDIAYTIVTSNATSVDANYNGLTLSDVSLTNIDNDLPAQNVSALINEVSQNPPATDNPFEYIELIGAPGTTLNGYYYVQFEGDSGAPGTADFVVSLNGLAFGSNGLLMIRSASGHTPPAATTVVVDSQLDTANGGLENGTVSSFLIYSPINPIVEATDYDTANSGTLTLPVGAIVQDSLGWTDAGAGDIIYSSVVLTQSSGTPDAATRFPGNTTPLSVAAWYNGDLDAAGANNSLNYDITKGSANIPATAVLTPGDTNVGSSNANPVVTATSPAVVGNEGTTLTNTGTWSDADAGNVVTLSASVGTIVKNADGTWNWSLASTDQEATTTVTITANDGVGGTGTTTFTYTVNNVAPALTRANATVAGNVLSTLVNNGTYSDVAADTVSLSVDVGSIVKNNDGTWSWSYAPTTAISNQTVTVTGTDEDGGSATVTFTINAVVNIATRGLFYNNATGASALASLGTDKAALLPGQTSTFANYTNYSRGLNGVAVDVAGLPATTTPALMLSSLQFAVWNGIDAAGFVALPATAIPSAAIVAGGGAGGSTRVNITFPDNTVQNTWLRVTVLANANTGLTSNDVFYFGNVIGELNTGNTATRLRVNSQDTSAVRNNQSTGTNSAGVTNIFDLNRDGRVNAQDTSIVRNNQQTSGIVAPITAPASIGPMSIRGGKTGGTSAPLPSSAPSIGGSISGGTGSMLSGPTETLFPTKGASQLVVSQQPSVDATEVMLEEVAKSTTTKKESQIESLDAFFASLWNGI